MATKNGRLINANYRGRKGYTTPLEKPKPSSVVLHTGAKAKILKERSDFQGQLVKKAKLSQEEESQITAAAATEPEKPPLRSFILTELLDT